MESELKYYESDIYHAPAGDFWYEPFVIPEEELPRALYELKPRKSPTKKGRPPASKRLAQIPRVNGTGAVRKRRISAVEKAMERRVIEGETVYKPPATPTIAHIDTANLVISQIGAPLEKTLMDGRWHSIWKIEKFRNDARDHKKAN